MASSSATRRSHHKEFQASRNGRTGDGGDHRLGQTHPGRSHRRVSRERIERLHRWRESVAATGSDTFEIGARAKRTARAPKHGCLRTFVMFKGQKSLDQRIGRRTVDGIARLGPVDDDGGHRAVAFDAYGFLFAHGFPCRGVGRAWHLLFRVEAKKLGFVAESD
jgi:hypothetical protein